MRQDETSDVATSAREGIAQHRRRQLFEDLVSSRQPSLVQLENDANATAARRKRRFVTVCASDT